MMQEDSENRLATTRAGGLPAVLGVAILSCLLAGGCQKKAPANPAATSPILTASGIEMMRIPDGDFLMGDSRGEGDEKPVHKVHISGFCMDKYEVTQKAYEGLMGTNPSKFKGPDRPVERVSWLAAVKYCNMRSLKEGLRPCYDTETLACDSDADGYRLPTEAEWEYACRAGSQGAYSYGDDAAMLREFGWFKGNSGEATHPVGLKKASPWGLYDMHGNVAEWCNDSFDESYYHASPPADPHGPQAGEKRILRGGSWRSEEQRCRCSSRIGEAPGFSDVCFGYEAYGFRCVKRVAPTLQ